MPIDSTSGKNTSLKTDASGALIVTAGGGGGAGGATAANQTTQITAANSSLAALQSMQANTPPLVSGRVPVAVETTVGLTNSELRAAPLFVTQTGNSVLYPVVVTAASALNAIMFTYDQSAGIAAYDSISYLTVQLSGTFVGTVAFEGSNDNVGYIPLTVTSIGSNIATTSSTIGGLYQIPVTTRYVRARMSAYTSGTATASVTGTNRPVPFLPTATAVTVASGSLTLGAATALVGDVGMGYRPGAASAASTSVVVAAASTNATIVKASAGRVVGWAFHNATATIVYVKFGNIATAPVPGTTPVTLLIAVPPNSSVSATPPGGVGFTTGIGVWTTANPGSADATAIGVNGVVGSVMFA